MSSSHQLYVLDAFAMLAVFRAEPGAQRMRQVVEQASLGQCSLLMTVVNAAEVYYRTAKEFDFDRADRVDVRLHSYAIDFVPVEEPLAREAGRIKALHPISYADCLVAALAQRSGAKILTGDRDFERFEGQIAVEWLPLP